MFRRVYCRGFQLASCPETAAEWGEKKSIANKFLQSNPVTTLCWPVSQPNFLVFGMSDGKVKAGNLKTNKSQTLYPSSSYVVSLAPSPDGTAFLSGHEDGSIFRFSFSDEGGQSSLLVKHPAPPYALAWAEQVLAAGPDKRLSTIIYDLQVGPPPLTLLPHFH